MDIEDLESVGMDRNRYHSKPQQVLPKKTLGSNNVCIYASFLVTKWTGAICSI